MQVEREYATRLVIGSVTIEQRDIDMLAAIDEFGSMHKAADELGRSYARLQNRIVEIESAVGSITERRRGGSGGGGTDLTETAHDLRRRFERHAVELDGVAHVTESVFTGPVRDRQGELATVDTDIGPILALVPDSATDVQVTVRSDAVVLTDPADAPRADGTSLRNQFSGTVSGLEAGESITSVTVRLADNAAIQALVTNASVDRLGLEAGREIAVSFKATAARAIALEGGETGSE
ncbi:TOBE domain-containing protein [Natronolimnobius baerhuensis]|uniref:Molybdenum-binding protein n=1 Tax=Natronolimnobius baerhuensis TaxID=253108 RepID=A0A202EAF5_9EURY|nr:TOBE domain-containing protein [Natronolimnobius baerhuensis]OVE85217.1 molybdenum-binding protein [Natronolimnobius baerhuensis]